MIAELEDALKNGEYVRLADILTTIAEVNTLAEISGVISHVLDACARLNSHEGAHVVFAVLDKCNPESDAQPSVTAYFVMRTYQECIADSLVTELCIASGIDFCDHIYNLQHFSARNATLTKAARLIRECYGDRVTSEIVQFLQQNIDDQDILDYLADVTFTEDEPSEVPKWIIPYSSARDPDRRLQRVLDMDLGDVTSILEDEIEREAEAYMERTIDPTPEDFELQLKLRSLANDDEIAQVWGPAFPRVSDVPLSALTLEQQTECPELATACQLYGGCRMLLCEGHDEVRDNDEESGWFTGECDNIRCAKKISKTHYAVRMPCVEGGWQGCYCSWRCVIAHNDLHELERSLIQLHMDEIDRAGIAERDEQREPEAYVNFGTMESVAAAILG